MNETLYFCRLCGRDSFTRRAVHKSSPGAGDQLVTLPKTESQARELARLRAAMADKP